MIAGIGTDVVDIERMKHSVDQYSNRLLERLFTLNERNYCLKKLNPSPHLAGRFAAKEAFFKALGTGLREGMSWQDLEICKTEMGAPFFHLTESMQQLLDGKNIKKHHVSITHSYLVASSVVVLEYA